MPQEIEQAAKTLDGTLVLFEFRDLNSASVCRLPAGAEFQLSPPTEFEGRRWCEVRLLDGTSGFALGPSVMGHTTAGVAASHRVNPVGDLENAFTRPAEPQSTLLLVLTTTVVEIAIVGILMHQSDGGLLSGLFQLVALFVVPLVGLCLNVVLCATGGVRNERDAWPIALIGPLLWALTILTFYFVRGHSLW